MIEQIAYHLNRRDEAPNQELAKVLALGENREGIAEIASYLQDKNKAIASDCLKVMYEIGYLRPDLIAQYLDHFLDGLKSKNNRTVWGSMIAIANISKVRPDDVYQRLALIENKIETGSVITHIWGVYTLINLAANGFYDPIKPKLFELQKSCRPIDFPKRAESIMAILQPKDYEAFQSILILRRESLSKAGQKKIDQLLK